MSKKKVVDTGLDVMVPTVTTVELRGQQVIIPLIKVKHLSAVFPLVAPFVELAKKINARTEETSVGLTALILGNAPKVVEMLSILLEKEEDWVNDLDLQELLTLIVPFLEANIDFFHQQIRPLLAGLVKQKEEPQQVSQTSGRKTSKS